LIIAAIGVVYGDIGTSVLYAVKEVFGHGHVPFTIENVYGILSMFFWTLTVIVSLNAAALKAPRSQWREVSVERSRIGSAELFESEWTSVRVSASKLGYVNLRAANLTDVAFEGCTIDEHDLARAARLLARASLRDEPRDGLDQTGVVERFGEELVGVIA
jgi:hypothetical protein